MAAKARARPAKATEEALLDAAERLFARFGLDGASLRQIGAAAGSANNFVVQYHFGDKAGLLRAIFERRLPDLEVRRAQLLAEAKRAGKIGDTRALTEVMLRPIVQVLDGEGRPSYAAFLLGLRHFEGSFGMRSDLADLVPLTEHVGELLMASTPHLPAALRRNRLAEMSLLFLGAMVAWDERRAAGRPNLLAWEDQVSEALDMAAAAFAAPVSPQVRAAL